MNNLPIIICAVAGIILMLVEVFMPGFGLPGLAGLALLLAAIVLTWVEYGAYAGLGATLIVIAVSAIALTISFKSATSGKLSRSPLILRESRGRAESYRANEDMSRLLGMEGMALSVLRPAGTAEFDGERIQVVSAGDFIEKGARIKVVEVEGARIQVKQLS